MKKITQKLELRPDPSPSPRQNFFYPQGLTTDEKIAFQQEFEYDLRWTTLVELWNTWQDQSHSKLIADIRYCLADPSRPSRNDIKLAIARLWIKELILKHLRADFRHLDKKYALDSIIPVIFGRIVDNKQLMDIDDDHYWKKYIDSSAEEYLTFVTKPGKFFKTEVELEGYIAKELPKCFSMLRIPAITRQLSVKGGRVDLCVSLSDSTEFLIELKTGERKEGSEVNRQNESQRQGYEASTGRFCLLLYAEEIHGFIELLKCKKPSLFSIEALRDLF
jgi:hypothetical protein